MNSDLCNDDSPGLRTLKDNNAVYQMPRDLREILVLVRRIGSSETDEVVKYHCMNAEREFDDLMRDFTAQRPKRELKVSLFLDKL